LVSYRLFLEKWFGKTDILQEKGKVATLNTPIISLWIVKLVYENKAECSNLWVEMSGPFSKSNAFRHFTLKILPLVGEIHFRPR